jgi:GNAT superfamily N-acetyltransferase
LPEASAFWQAEPVPSSDPSQNAIDIRVQRLTSVDETALQLIEEYYAAIQVVQRDTRDDMQRTLEQAGSALWLAYKGDAAVGCVLLKPLPSIPFACECKRLYVRPTARGLGVASLLMETLESFARAAGYRTVYLDSYDKLEAAIALYRQRGYVPCERYNENPQATVFLRKELTVSLA